MQEAIDHNASMSLGQSLGSMSDVRLNPAIVARAVSDELVSGRVWLYSNYHCNLACSYCLTESAPGAAPRELPASRMLDVADQARSLGFTGIGVTGGEPFLRADMPALLAGLAQNLPVIVLSNGTLFDERRAPRLAPLGSLPVAIQISLDRPDPSANDAMRGPENFEKVIDAIPRLVGMGIRVRIGTTLEDPDAVDPEETRRLCELHRSLGVGDEDHVVRPIVRRGRARAHGLGAVPTPMDLEPELTITADGAFWSPFGPTVAGGRLDTDLMLTRTTEPLAFPADMLVRLAAARPGPAGGSAFR